ncbi:hypothetical protein HQ560_12945, partial [bacterium]|nr:hypothetical protein [bacterium]
MLCVFAWLRDSLRNRGQRAALAAMGLFTFAWLLNLWGLDADLRLLILPTVGTVLAMAAFFLVQDRGRDWRLGVLVIASVLVMVITPMGSNTGLWKAVHGMWAALPLALLLTYRMGDTVRRGWLKSICSLTTPVIGLLAVTAGVYQFSNTCRDDRNRFHL